MFFDVFGSCVNDKGRKMSHTQKQKTHTILQPYMI